MLIVDSDQSRRTKLEELFKSKLIIDTASDGVVALSQLRRNGANTAVVLLELDMPGLDGFAVLSKMSESAETKAIPVIVMIEQGQTDDYLRAIQAGAVDYVLRPIDTDLLLLRVELALARIDSERRRAQSYYSLLQSNEEAKYRSVLHSTCTVVIELDWEAGIFTYDDDIALHMAGIYDSRPLWQILTADCVATPADIQAMRRLVNEIACDDTRDSGDLNTKLLTQQGDKQWFSMHVFKRKDKSQLSVRLIITFVNINEEVVAEEKLHYQAEKDALTGLWNRCAFFQKAYDMIHSKKPGSYAMVCFDLDNFKVINDQYGSKKGDEVLRFIADVFSQTFGGVGGIVSRIDGDNFAVICPTRYIKSTKLNTALDRISTFDGSNPPISFSIGLYAVDDLSLPISSM